ncbi:MAG: di-heme oxidoredictase family protein, partial [Longimicrobiales bacterium]|nr:di-heme oxidoredictase family protein [Longimicrobiales bacterium]
MSAEIGTPLPGLTPEELERFEAGRTHFTRRFTPDEGLGPRFNEDACNACHTMPADGGTGETSVTKATRTLPDGRCDPLVPHGGENVRISVTPALAAAGGGRVPVPENATNTALFTIPFVFGLGIVDAIPQEALDDLADPDDADRDGISGRLGRNVNGEPARFGRKADQATLLDFVE